MEMDLNAMMKERGKSKSKPSAPSYEDDSEMENEAEGEDMDGAALMKQLHESMKGGDYEAAWETLQTAVMLAQDSESEEES